MTDPCLELLCQQLHKFDGKKLWLADELHSDILPSLQPFGASLQVLSNRYDIAEKAVTLGLVSHFNDWQFECIGCVAAAFLRVCKEKQVTKHLIQQAFNQLEVGGTLVVVGQKNEGIKSYEKIASFIFTGNEKGKHLKKSGNNYIATFTKAHMQTQSQESDYNQISEIARWNDCVFYSKPGVYGWDKIDNGSALLIEHLDTTITEHNKNIDSILDLGCGYGFLAMASGHIKASRRVATDNNAGALICCEHNSKLNDLDLEVIAADCGDRVEGLFDLILCNPPFHRGFDVDSDLTHQFLHASEKKLSAKGLAIFVVNSFIPIEKKLNQYFNTSKMIVNTGQFKVLALSNKS